MLCQRTLLLITLFAITSCYAQQNERDEFIWADTVAYLDIHEAKYPGSILVVRDIDYLQIGNLPQPAGKKDAVVKWFGTQHLKLVRYHFRSQSSIDQFLQQTTEVRKGFQVAVFDARIIRKGEPIQELNATNCIVERLLDPKMGIYQRKLEFRHIDLRPDDQFEFVSIIVAQGIRLQAETLVRGEYPILEKQIIVDTWDLPQIEMDTYNGFPEPAVLINGARIQRKWTFFDLPARQLQPYQVSNLDAPFYSFRSGFHMNTRDLLREFLLNTPYQRYSGRSHLHAFLEHYENRVREIGVRNRTALVSDIVRFFRDSITMVEDEEIDNQEPVGWHFKSRTLSEEKLFHLYRHFFKIMDVPLYMAFVRDRYLANVEANTLYGEDLTDHMLAFKNEQTGRFHFIALNNLRNKYLVDEIPYYLSGQTAMVIECDDEKLNLEKSTQKLPGLTPSDNLLSERFRIEIRTTGNPLCDGRGVVSGTLRQGWDASQSMSNVWPINRPELTPPQKRHIAVDSIEIELSLPPKLRYTVTPLPPAVEVTENENKHSWEVDLKRMIAPPTFGTTGIMVPPNSLLPYPYVQRYDVIITFPMDIELIKPITPIALENTFGNVNRTCEQRDKRTIHWHLDHALVSVWVDRTMQPIYLDLLSAMVAPSTFTFVVRQL